MEHHYVGVHLQHQLLVLIDYAHIFLEQQILIVKLILVILVSLTVKNVLMDLNNVLILKELILHALIL